MKNWNSFFRRIKFARQVKITLIVLALGALVVSFALGRNALNTTTPASQLVTVDNSTLTPEVTTSPTAIASPTKIPATKAPTPTTAPKVSASHTVNNYSITGNNENELRSEMNNKGPLAEDGQHYDAFTSWNIQWTYPKKTTSKGCETGGVVVFLVTKTTLPNWIDNAAAPNELKTKWNQFLSSLTAHENGHKQFAIKRADEVLSKLSAIGSQSTCEQLDSLVNTVGQEVLTNLRQEDSAFDAQTDHGRNQGAKFP